MKNYTVSDGESYSEIIASSLMEARETAVEWVMNGSTPDRDKTFWVDVHLSGDDFDEKITVAIDPKEPSCSADEHHWHRPHDVVGGLPENPGVHSNGGGVIVTSVCAHCDTRQVTNTWDYRPDTGEQGLVSVSYSFNY